MLKLLSSLRRKLSSLRRNKKQEPAVPDVEIKRRQYEKQTVNFEKKREVERRKEQLQEKIAAQAKEKNVKIKKRLAPSKKGDTETIIGKGFVLGKKDTAITIKIPDAFRVGMMWTFGTTRSGKTKLAEGIIEQDLRKGFNVVVYDPKGDPGLFSKIVQVAWETGRMDDLMLVTPIFPDLSAIIDPMASYYMPEELIAHSVSGVSIGKEPYYFNVSYEMASAVIHGLIAVCCAEGRPPSFNLKEVEGYISYEGLSRLKKKLETMTHQVGVPDTIQKMEQILATPPDFFSKVGSSLRVALSELTSGAVGKIIGKADENRFLHRLENGKGVILVVQTGSMLANRAGYTAGKVILSMIQTYVGRILASGKKMNPALCLHIDEAHSVIYPGFTEMLAKSGSSNCFVAGYNQSISQLYDAIGEDLANTTLDNCNTKCFLRVPDALTADFIARHLGERKAWAPMISFGGGLTIRQTEEAQVRPSDIMGLSPRQFFFQTYSGLYQGKTIDVEDSWLQVKFPAPNIVKRIS